MNDNDFDDKDEKIIEILKKIKKSESQDYPRFSKRRESFIRSLFLSKYFLLIVLLLVIIILCIIFYGGVGYYSGLNKGIYVLNCGIEFVGDFGMFCGDY